MTTNQPIYQSRWGYHCCSHELFLKLKQLYKWYWQTIYDFHRWHRWSRKDPTHRHGPEPAYCPTFVINSEWRKPVRTHGINGFKVYCRTVVDLGIPELYRSARIPAATPMPVLDVDTQAKMERLYEAVKSYFEESSNSVSSS